MVMAKAKAARGKDGTVAKDRKGKARGGGPSYRTLVVDVRDCVALVALARPDVHNAFNETLIAELTRRCGRSTPTTRCAPSSCSATAEASAPAPTSTG